MRPKTRQPVKQRHQRKTERIPEVEPEYSSLDIEYEGTHRSYNEHLHKLLPKSTYEETSDEFNSDHELSAHDPDEEDEVVSVPDDDDKVQDEPEISREEDNEKPTPDERQDAESKDDNVRAHYDSEPDLGDYTTLVLLKLNLSLPLL